ncbi:CynX/NimT family MFS transporter [Paeniglutamicibacter cryotolerans]|uniref:CP family cyanate transporter-like MFS transporter n=1 Tax=Paeniglutamicibacter cryotolerans TaxID=670079 RepID=A0A839QHM3_9MICC|nr:CP family cyanate transporter-like MFS transporter [Paeniglutamicibacter cryotolerans]
MKRAVPLLGLLAAFAVGLNLRPAITSVAAILQELTATAGLAPADVVLLSSLPVAAFGLSAPLIPLLTRRLGTELVLLASMLLLAGSLGMRALVPGLLLLCTFTAGVAIMGGSILMPQYLKELRASPRAVGIATTTFGVGAAAGASLTRPVVAAAGGNLSAGLGIWTVLAIAAAVLVWVRAASAGGAVPVREPGGGLPAPAAAAARGAARVFGPEGRRTAALIGAVFGLQAILYFAVSSWLPTIQDEAGIDRGTAANMLAWFSAVGFISTLLTPMLMAHLRLLRLAAALIGACVAFGFGWLALGGAAGSFGAITLLGFSQSAAFGLSMALIVAKTANGAIAGKLSAVSQGFGYVAAALGSALIGGLRTWTGSWNASLALMSLLALAMGVVAVLAVGREAISGAEHGREE